MATQLDNTVEAEPAFISVAGGDLLVMIDERWFRETDPNRDLNRHVTKIGLALCDFAYEEGVGGVPNRDDVATFTLRQYWQDKARPTLDFTERGINKWLEYLEKYLGLIRRAAIEKHLRPGIKKFAETYKRYQQEKEILEAQES